MARSVAERSGPPATIEAAVRLCIVFDQFQSVFPAQLADSVRVSALPVKVDYQNSPGTGSDGLLDQ